MKTLIVTLCLLSSLTAQTTKKFNNVVIEIDNKLFFVNWFRTDSSLIIYETVVDKNNPNKPNKNYWWAKKDNDFWLTNLPKNLNIYVEGLKKDEISWMNLPNISKETTSIGFNNHLPLKKINYWISY